MGYERLYLKDGERTRAVHISHIEDGIIDIESYLEEIETKYPKERAQTWHTND